MTTIGVLGAGQLARMLAIAGYPIGLNFVFFDSNSDACAAPLGEFICAELNNEQKLKEFAEKVDVITLENENIPIASIEYLQKFKPVRPGILALETSQDRLKEKNFCNEIGIPTAKFVSFDNKDELNSVFKTIDLPLLIKTRTMGYDGKGQLRIDSPSDLRNIQLPTSQSGWIAESLVSFQREISMIAVKSITGEIAFYDICENGHDNGILRQTRNNPGDSHYNLARDYSKKLLESLDYVGVLCLEFFVVGDNLLLNEFAPRVHNSGHWTIDGASTSQFENHLRAIVGWPLGDTKSLGRSIMTNFIGEMPPIQSLLSHSDMHVHDYRKAPRPNRKIGHMTKVIR
jgi:5-(carboxyamino)imidazole ribonucleotide synthase